MKRPALMFVLLAACAGDPDPTSPVTQIGSHVIPVESVRTQLPPSDWKVVQQRLSDLGITPPATIFEFAPTEGEYDQVGESIFRHDTCGIADGTATVAHLVSSVDTRVHTYANDYLDISNENVLRTLGCEFFGTFYRCDRSADRIDFHGLGLDAVVTINNDEFGNWVDPNASLPAAEGFTGVFIYDISCTGRDCKKEPCASLFGFLTEPLPCKGDEGEVFGIY